MLRQLALDSSLLREFEGRERSLKEEAERMRKRDREEKRGKKEKENRIQRCTFSFDSVARTLSSLFRVIHGLFTIHCPPCSLFLFFLVTS